MPVNWEDYQAGTGPAASQKQARWGPGTGGFPDNTGDLQAIYRDAPSIRLVVRSAFEDRALRKMCLPPMVRDAALRAAPHHEVRSLPPPQAGLPDLRIKKPTSGRPEIGAQFQLWIFSYTIRAQPS